jgi:hypothetical protein
MPNPYGLIKPVTGIGVTTSVSMESADLGIVRWDPQRQAIAAMFGDNFSQWRMHGDWQSPSIVMYDKDMRVLGVPTEDGIAPNEGRRQLWDYPHDNPDYSTVLPCDFIRVRDWWYVAAMVTAGLGHEKRTVFWRSRDLIDWEKTEPYVSLVHLDEQMRPIGHPGNVMLTFDQIDDWVYIFGTAGLARDKPIWMWRCEASTFPNGLWEPWGFDNRTSWAWGNPNELTPILPGKYGELCFRYIQGNCVLSFFDVGEYKMTALTVPKPNDYWPSASRVDYASGLDFPQLYGGYIVPGSVLNEQNGMKFLVSQWNTSNNDPYHVVQFNDTLVASGVLQPDEPHPPTPPPTPEEPTVPEPEPVPTDMKELLELLLRELSASGSILITTPEGKNLTLREAIGEIFEKERDWFGLEARPRHPNKTDDQLGHILSSRAEGLITQSLVVAIADKFGIDTQAIYEGVKGSFNEQ